MRTGFHTAALVALALCAGGTDAQAQRTASKIGRGFERNAITRSTPTLGVSRQREGPLVAGRTGDARVDDSPTGPTDRTETEPTARGLGGGYAYNGTTTFTDEEIACCLRFCRKELFMCDVGNPNTCPSDDGTESLDTPEFKTRLQCLAAHKCCLETNR